MVSCLIFVVGALLEFAVVVIISRSSVSRNKKSIDPQTRSSFGNLDDLMEEDNRIMCWKENETVPTLEKNEAGDKSLPSSTRILIDCIFPHINKIDLCAFCAYLCVFVLFNCIYWPYYL